MQHTIYIYVGVSDQPLPLHCFIRALTLLII